MITNPTTIQSTAVSLASADQIHEYLVKAYRIGNRARLRFARLLAARATFRLFLKLGHPGIAQDAARYFDVQRSETYELIRVAEVIDDLPACRKAFEEGRFSWSTLKLVTRVAGTETEKTRLEFNEDHSCTEVHAEVQDAFARTGMCLNACPECRKAGLMTLDGPIEVAAGSVDRLASDAAEETMDRRNSSTLARRVKLRDGGVCQNPGCSHRGDLHTHHIEYRSHGGPTIPENENSA